MSDTTESLTSLPILSPKALAFASAVASGSSMVEAYKKAFPEKEQSKFIAQYAYRLARNPKVREQIELIQQATRMEFVIAAPGAFDRLKELSESADSEKVKLEANKEILDRAGLKPPERAETVHIGIFGSASAEDIRNIIRGKIVPNEK